MKKKILTVLISGVLMLSVLAGCGNKTEPAEANADSTEVSDEAVPDNNMAVTDEETPAASGALEIVYSDDMIDLAQYKGIQAQAYENDVTDEYVNEYINSILIYTYGNDEEGNPLYTSETMTDDVAAELMDGGGSVAEYKEIIKATLEEESQKYYDEELTVSLFDQVVAASDVKDYPQEEIDKYIEYLNDYYSAYAESVGMDLNNYISASLGYETEEEYNKAVEEEAKENVKIQHVVAAICGQEGYTPTDEDKQAMVEKFVEMGYAESEDAVKENLSDEEIELNTMYYKVLDIIKENAVVN